MTESGVGYLLNERVWKSVNWCHLKEFELIDCKLSASDFNIDVKRPQLVSEALISKHLEL